MNFVDQLTIGSSKNFTDNRRSVPLTEEEILGFTLTTIYLTLRGLQGTIAITANLLTIIAVCKCECLWEKCTVRFVVSLACADLVGGVAAFVHIARNIVVTVPIQGVLLCYVELFLGMLSGYGNVYTILYVTIDRFIYITRPMRYDEIVTKSRAIAAIVIVWCVNVFQIIIQLGFAVPVSIGQPCEMDKLMKKIIPYGLPQILLVSFGVVLPCNIKIMLTVRHLNQTEPHLSCYPPELQAQQRERLKQRKMAKTMAYVLIPYFMCNYLPSFYPWIYQTLTNDSHSLTSVLGTRICGLLFWVQTLSNPFVYGYKNLEFRQAYKKLLCSRNNSVGTVVEL